MGLGSTSVTRGRDAFAEVVPNYRRRPTARRSVTPWPSSPWSTAWSTTPNPWCSRETVTDSRPSREDPLYQLPTTAQFLVGVPPLDRLGGTRGYVAYTSSERPVSYPGWSRDGRTPHDLRPKESGEAWYAVAMLPRDAAGKSGM
jgi:hypothetical protein